MRIVVLDGAGLNPGDLSWKPFEEFGEVTVYPRSTPDEVVARAADADIVFTNKVVFDETVIASLPNLKYIGVLGGDVHQSATDGRVEMFAQARAHR